MIILKHEILYKVEQYQFIISLTKTRSLLNSLNKNAERTFASGNFSFNRNNKRQW